MELSCHFLHSESRKSSSQMLKWFTRVACLNCAFMLKGPFAVWSVFGFWSIYPRRSLQEAIVSTTPWLSSQGSAICSHRLLRKTEINVAHQQWLTFLTTRHFSNLHAGQQVLAGSVWDKDLFWEQAVNKGSVIRHFSNVALLPCKHHEVTWVLPRAIEILRRG